MNKFRFTKLIPTLNDGKTQFDKLFEIFQEILIHTSGDVAEGLKILSEIDRKYQLTENNYGIGNFVEELKKKGFIKDDIVSGQFKVTDKTKQSIRKSSLDQIFGKLKKSLNGNHKTSHTGIGDEVSSDIRNFQFGDSYEQIAITESINNAFINQGIDNFDITERDLEIREKEHKSQSSTVLMIDISHSMILYGEDRITPAKKVAMALSELIQIKYPKDTLDIIVFGNDAWQIEVKDLPFLEVGPFYTNTVAGLELAMDLLRRRKNPNKQIFMITDGKPTCIKEGNSYYQNSWGLDRKILNKCYALAASCRRLKVPVTTFMIAQDSYLQQFVQE
ncbi:MAG: VWA domain-containing protein, partial [Candidatus Kapaibacterium sp.]